MTSGGGTPRVLTELPGPRSRELMDRARPHLNAAILEHTNWPFVETGRDGYFIVDADGNRFIDMITAWGASPYGATPPKVRAAMNRAWDRHGLEISVAVLNAPALDLAEKLTTIAPAHLTRAEFAVTGTLAVEAAVKHARYLNPRPVLLVFGDTFHGDGTYLTATASTENSSVSAGSTQYAPGIVHVPYPNRDRSPFRPGPGPHDDTEVLEYLRRWVLPRQVAPDQIGAVLIEPILTEMGAIKPSQAFWDQLTELCRMHDWLLICDEVQTGFGRCGTRFAVEQFANVKPDLMPLGKGLSAGGSSHRSRSRH